MHSANQPVTLGSIVAPIHMHIPVTVTLMSGVPAIRLISALMTRLSIPTGGFPVSIRGFLVPTGGFPVPTGGLPISLSGAFNWFTMWFCPRALPLVPILPPSARISAAVVPLLLRRPCVPVRPLRCCSLPVRARSSVFGRLMLLPCVGRMSCGLW